jgi:hypothetical protein
MKHLQLSDTLITAVARLVDDAQIGVKREPTHSTLSFHLQQSALLSADPQHQGHTVGKAKRVRAVLSWAMENAPEAGGRFAISLIGVIKGCGGFRASSANFVGTEVITDAIEAFASDGYVLTQDGTLGPLFLDSLAGHELTVALAAYVRRAKRGAMDAALVTGTGKDLLEAVAKHVLIAKYNTEPTVTNFPTLLGQAFTASGLSTSAGAGDSPQKRIDASLYQTACAVNSLRNSQGTGHGRAFPPSVTDAEARVAVECMGVVADRLLGLL